MIRPILLNILGPILLLILLGAIMRRKFRIDVGTLSKLNLYLFTPAFLFDQVSRSSLSAAAMGGVILISVIQVATLGGVVWGIGRVLRVNPRTLAAIAMAVMFYNSGNYGLPLAALAFPSGAAPLAVATAPTNAPKAATGITQGTGEEPNRAGLTAPAAAGVDDRDGAAVQAFVVFSLNLLTFTVGLTIASWAGSGDLLGGLKALWRLPTIPTITAALIARWWAREHGGVPILIAATTDYLSKGLVPTALVTLGAQLAVNPRWPRWRPVSMAVILRLAFGPIQMAALLYGFHRLGIPALDLWPWPAELLILTSAVPTAVTTLLLTLEVGGDADLAADCVFWTTVISCVTITACLLVLRATLG